MDSSFNNDSKKEIDIIRTFLIFWKRRYFISVFTTFFAIISIFYSLSLQNIYTSTALLIPYEKSDNQPTGLSALSGYTAAVGINLQEDATINESVARIQSFQFFSEHLLSDIKLQDILAVKKWDKMNNKLIYEKELFDEKSNKWVRDFTYPQQQIPSDQEAFRAFKSSMYAVIDKEKSFINIGVNHQSPYIAKEWLEKIIINFNESMRMEDIESSKSNIDFLSTMQGSTNIQSIRDVASNLLESQMQTLMLASSNKDYVLKVIDKPIAPELKTSPNRAIICIVITLFGLAISLIFVFIKDELLIKDELFR